MAPTGSSSVGGVVDVKDLRRQGVYEGLRVRSKSGRTRFVRRGGRFTEMGRMLLYLMQDRAPVSADGFPFSEGAVDRAAEAGMLIRCLVRRRAGMFYRVSRGVSLAHLGCTFSMGCGAVRVCPGRPLSFNQLGVGFELSPVRTLEHRFRHKMGEVVHRVKSTEAALDEALAHRLPTEIVRIIAEFTWFTIIPNDGLTWLE